jgi:hypothetical protein
MGHPGGHIYDKEFDAPKACLRVAWNNLAVGAHKQKPVLPSSDRPKPYPEDNREAIAKEWDDKEIDLIAP